MKPAPLDIDVYRGDFWSLFFRVRKRDAAGVLIGYEDLTGWTGISQIRETEDSVALLAEIMVTFSDQVAYPGGVLLSMSGTVTSGLNFLKPAKWDVQLTNTLGEPNTFLKGNATLDKDVSRVQPAP